MNEARPGIGLLICGVASLLVLIGIAALIGMLLEGL